MERQSAMKTIYHVHDGPSTMYLIDAKSAVARFPDEWSDTPWKKDGKKAEPIVEIPGDWQDLKPTERIALAIRLGAKRKGLTAAKADDVIEAEVETRAAAAEEAPAE